MRSKEQIYKRMNREKKKKFSLKRLKKPIKEHFLLHHLLYYPSRPTFQRLTLSATATARISPVNDQLTLQTSVN